MSDKKYLTSIVSCKGQTTIPSSIIKVLRIKPGDAIIYDIEGDIVRIRKTEGIDLEWAIAIERTLTEWSGPEDDDL